MKNIAKKVLQEVSCHNGVKSRFCVILGIQWGQEGKYKILDKLCEDYDYSVRFNGGSTSDPVVLDNGDEINLLPYGIQKEFRTKCLIGNGVVIDPKTLLNDFHSLERNGIEYKHKTLLSQRCHLVTEMHRKIKDSIRECRQDKIWLSSEDIAQAYKPMKMGLRLALLRDDWTLFKEAYDRVAKTSNNVFSVDVTMEEREKDLHYMHELRDIILRDELVKDTVVHLNQEIKRGKRILVEDCSSSTMDIDTGIYPYVDSFHTTSGAVCTGLGVPEEDIETTIGVFSAITVLDKAFLSQVQKFPTQILEEDEQIQQGLEKNYLLPKEEFAYGWTDLNLLMHAERINKLSSIFLTHMDLLDHLDEIPVCTGYKDKLGNVTMGRMPATIKEFSDVTAEWVMLKGWKQDTSKCKRFDELPTEAQSFVKFIEQTTKKEVTFVSTSADEEEGMLRTRLN